MNFPTELKYTKDHEWIKLEGKQAVVGITEFAQRELGDIVFLDITTLGKTVQANEVFGTVEAVKTVSDLFMPMTGQIVEINSALNDAPELVNQDPYHQGWMVKVNVEDASTYHQLLSAEEYQQLVAH